MEVGAAVRSAAAATLVVFLVLPLVLPLVRCHGDHNAPRKCGPHLSTPGFTVPKGDIIIREGDPLEILCVLTAPYQQERYHNATDLRFYHNETLVDPKYLEVVNETTLRFYMKEAPAMKAMFYCKLKQKTWANSVETSVCLNSVFVGHEPLGVDSFNCISYNWVRLNCSWVPKYNPVPTTYQIFFQTRTKNDRTLYKCPNNSDQNESTCLWTDSTSPSYRQPHPFLDMTLTGTNALSNKAFTFELDQYARIVPAAPTNFEVLNMTSSSFFLKWIVPYPMDIWARSHKLVHKVAYATIGPKESTDSADRFKVAFRGTPKCTSDHSFQSLSPENFVCYYNLTGLDYAYYLYDVRVTIKTENATDAFWSSPATQVRKTAPSIPPMPPTTDVGSFEVAYKLPLRDVTIYWKSLPEYLHSGANFSYRIVQVLRNNTTTSSVKIDFLGKKSAVLRNLEQYDTLVVRIASSNEVGDSKSTSVITIPGVNHTLLEPESFTKTSLRNGDFKLTWKSPKGGGHLVKNYTIFWCDSLNDRPETCSGYLNWTHVNGDAREVNVRLKPTMYHFAISANTEERSSGMVWASCSMVADKVDKLKTVYVERLDATSMDVEWKLDCTDANNVVKGFIIFYCVANHGMDQGCKDAEHNMTIIGDHNKRSAKLTDLQPYVTYRVAVAIKTEVGRSLPSDPIFKTMSEAAPSTPPLDIKVLDVTNNSITVSWMPPSKPNGVLRYYEVSWNGNYTKVTLDASKKTQVTLTHLESYTNYSIWIKACTLECSSASQPITTRTLIGAPGEMSPPSYTYQNSSQVRLSWAPPRNRGGNIDYYMITTNVIHNNGVVSETAQYNVTDTECYVPVGACEIDESFRFNVTIRAVNVDADGRDFKGLPTGVDIPCLHVPRVVNVVVWSILAVLGALMFVVSGVWYGKSFYRECRETRGLDVKLPAGMMPKDKKDPNFKDLTWGPHDPENDDSSGNTRPPPDKERLLHGKDEPDRNNESSGCCSGHDTVSSSTTSGTHISADSGTELDQNEQGFTDSPKWAAVNSQVGNTMIENKGKVEPGWDPSPYVHVGSPTSGEVAATKSLYPNLEAGNWLPPSGGYVAMTGKDDTLSPQIDGAAPQSKPSRGYVAHDANLANSALWAKPNSDGVFYDGYVQTGTNPDKKQDLVEDEKEEEGGKEYITRSLSASNSVVNGGACERTSVEVPLVFVVPTRTTKGYVAHPFIEHKAPPVRHEYVRTADKNPSTLKLDNTKPYTRLGEREPQKLVTTPEIDIVPATDIGKPTILASGYVPHKQFEKRATSGVVHE